MDKLIRNFLALVCLVSSFVPANAEDIKTHSMREVIVTARRPMKEIGVEQTVLDSIALKENIALSMADVLAYNSSIFVKSYGRATLSTVSFRGTSPGHTQVSWNGMHINNPMLGTTDFSTIPSYFIDKAGILHGTSSVNETGGGLGGAVSLSTSPVTEEGFGAQYIQGIGSFSTFDEFGRFTWANKHWSLSTRAVYSSSPNDFKFVNHDKKLNIYDDEHNIIGQYHPTERNRNGAFRDFHVLQDIYYDNLRGDRLGLSVWYINSNRELPLISTDYGDPADFENRQRDHTLRAVMSWHHAADKWRTSINAGYNYTWLAYDYNREISEGNRAIMTRSRSNVNTIYAQGNFEIHPSAQWMLTANISAHQQLVRSKDRNVIVSDGYKGIIGYDKGRLELSGAVSAKWQPTDRLGMSTVLRQEMYGDKFAKIIPAFFVDGVIVKSINLVAKVSVSRNYKAPSLNDLYFLPGGNPDLRSEKGFTYDVGLSMNTALGGCMKIGGNINWFDSSITDWIIWLPTTKGFFSPHNVSKVHAYGVETALNAQWIPSQQLNLDLTASYSFTPSIDKGRAVSDADRSVGRQLPYVPRHSASMVGRLTWRTWSLLYKWCYYSRRYTMSSNESSVSGYLPDYYMNSVSVEKNFKFKPLDMSLKLAVNNLFNEEYLSVLSRPMPGINFEFFISITPKFSRK